MPGRGWRVLDPGLNRERVQTKPSGKAVLSRTATRNRSSLLRRQGHGTAGIQCAGVHQILWGAFKRHNCKHEQQADQNTRCHFCKANNGKP
jgi:hypothetical protein